VAQAIVNRLELKWKAVGDKVRYASALVDEELTVLEGAERSHFMRDNSLIVLH
jgi:hypothetical protein